MKPNLNVKNGARRGYFVIYFEDCGHTLDVVATKKRAYKRIEKLQAEGDWSQLIGRIIKPEEIKCYQGLCFQRNDNQGEMY